MLYLKSSRFNVFLELFYSFHKKLLFLSVLFAEVEDVGSGFFNFIFEVFGFV
jgi:hypothetical protein